MWSPHARWVIGRCVSSFSKDVASSVHSAGSAILAGQTAVEGEEGNGTAEVEEEEEGSGTTEGEGEVTQVSVCSLPSFGPMWSTYKAFFVLN